MRTDIIKKIEDMKASGELNTEQSVSLILQICFELFMGQQEIAKSLDARQEAIDALKIQITAHEKESELHVKEHEGIYSRLDKIEKKMETTESEVGIIKGASIIIWCMKHPKLATGIVIVFLLSLNIHDLVIPYLFGLFGYKIP